MSEVLRVRKPSLLIQAVQHIAQAAKQNAGPPAAVDDAPNDRNVVSIHEITRGGQITVLC